MHQHSTHTNTNTHSYSIVTTDCAHYTNATHNSATAEYILSSWWAIFGLRHSTDILPRLLPRLCPCIRRSAVLASSSRALCSRYHARSSSDIAANFERTQSIHKGQAVTSTGTNHTIHVHTTLSPAACVQMNESNTSASRCPLLRDHIASPDRPDWCKELLQEVHQRSARLRQIRTQRSTLRTAPARTNNSYKQSTNKTHS